MSYGSKQTISWRIFLIPVLALCVFLIGCATKQEPPALPDEKMTVDFDKRLLKECQKVPRLEGSTDVQIKNNYEQFLKVYSECATLKKKQNEEIKKALNIKD